MIESDKIPLCCECIGRNFDFHESLVARIYEISKAKDKVLSVCEENRANGRCDLIKLNGNIPSKEELLESIIKDSVRKKFT